MIPSSMASGVLFSSRITVQTIESQLDYLSRTFPNIFAQCKSLSSEATAPLREKIDSFPILSLFQYPTRPQFFNSLSDIAGIHNFTSIPIIGFCGRSNVGKSSLLNALTTKKYFASSKTPGKTQKIGAISIGPKSDPWLRLVDLPGYGFAKAPIKVIDRWNHLIGDFIQHVKPHMCVLVDSKIGLQPIDIDFLDLLDSLECDYSLVLTKSDRVRDEVLASSYISALSNMVRIDPDWFESIETIIRDSPSPLSSLYTSSGGGRHGIKHQSQVPLSPCVFEYLPESLLQNAFPMRPTMNNSVFTFSAKSQPLVAEFRKWTLCHIEDILDKINSVEPSTPSFPSQFDQKKSLKKHSHKIRSSKGIKFHSRAGSQLERSRRRKQRSSIKSTHQRRCSKSHTGISRQSSIPK